MIYNKSQGKLTEILIIVTLKITLLLILISSKAFSQNTTINPNLNSDLTPWNATLSVAPDPNGFGSVSWTNIHNNDNIMNGSGSAQVQLSTPPVPPNPANASSGFQQCIVFPSPPVSVMTAKYGTHVLIPLTGNPVNGSANASIEVRFFSDGNCLDFIPGAGGNQGKEFNGALSDADWYVLEDNSLVMPNGAISASSAEVRGFLRTTGTSSDNYIAFFDHVFLALNGSLPVELLHFSID